MIICPRSSAFIIHPHQSPIIIIHSSSFIISHHSSGFINHPHQSSIIISHHSSFTIVTHHSSSFIITLLSKSSQKCFRLEKCLLELKPESSFSYSKNYTSSTGHGGNEKRVFGALLVISSSHQPHSPDTHPPTQWPVISGH